jgi:CBS domain-containing protein
VTIGNLIIRKPVTVGPDESLANVKRIMKQANVGAVVIAKHHHPLGTVTDRDLALAVCNESVPITESVHTVMTCSVESLSPSGRVCDATRRMMKLQVRRLPVVDSNGNVIGLVSLDDLLLQLSREPNLTESLKPDASQHNLSSIF